MVVVGFFFATVSGNLVGMIGSSNNPMSGLTLCTLVIAALLMVALGVSGSRRGGGAGSGGGGLRVIGGRGRDAARLEGRPHSGWHTSNMQIGDLMGVIVASLVLFFPLMLLHEGISKPGALELATGNCRPRRPG